MQVPYFNTALKGFSRKKIITLQDTFRNSPQFEKEYSNSFLTLMDKAIKKINNRAKVQKSCKKTFTQQYDTFVSPVNLTRTKKQYFKVNKPRHMSLQNNNYQNHKVSILETSNHSIELLFNKKQNEQQPKQTQNAFKAKKSNFLKKSKNINIRIRKLQKLEDKSRPIVKQGYNDEIQKKHKDKSGKIIEASDTEPINAWIINDELEGKEKIFY